MASTKIQNLPIKSPIGSMKIPTGGFGDYSITVNGFAEFIIDAFNIATTNYVDNIVADKEDRILTTGGNLSPVSKLTDVPDTNNDVIDEVAQALLDRIEYVKDNFSSAPSHNELLGRSATGAHPSTSISHKSGTVYTYLQSNETDINKIKNVDIPSINNSLSDKQDLISTGAALSPVPSLSAVPSLSHIGVNTAVQSLLDRTAYYSNHNNLDNRSNPNSHPATAISDGSENQKQINDKTIQKVATVSELRNLTPRGNGQIVETSGHTVVGIGSGKYIFEQLSSKTDNNGTYIASNATTGTWVLISDLHFENFGVTDEDSDQSDKLQACIDFAFSQNIISYGFEKSFKCRIDKEIVFRAIKTPSDWGMPAQRTEVSMRGAMFVSSVDNLTYIRVLRDRVKFVDTLAMDGLGSSGQIGIELGYNKDNDPMDTTLRRSACFFGLNGYIPANIDIGIKSNIPRSINGSAYGMYNHTIYNFDARHVNIGWYADKGFPDDPVTNKLTRTRIFGFGHIDGACSFYMLACESFKCYGYSGEHINKDDPRLPDGKAVGWYSPEKSNPIDTYQNSYNYISGYIEQAYREYINQSVFFTWDVQSWFTGTSQNIAQQGQAELSLSKMGIGSNGTFYNNRSVKDFHFKNGGFRTAVVSIAKDSPANSSLPNYYRGKDFYGNIEWVPMANDFEDAGLLILSDYFWSDGGFRQYVAQYRNGVWSEWVDRAFKYGIGSNDIVLNNSTLNNFKFNDGGIRFAQVAITGDDPTSAASTPNGNYFYGAVQWIQINNTEGKQIAWGVAPNVNNQRIFTGGVWSAWTDL